MQRLRDICENEIWTIDVEDVRELLDVDARCPHQFVSVTQCSQCLYIIAAMALDRLKETK